MFWLRNKKNFYFIQTSHERRCVLLDFSLTEKAATLIFISGRGSAISSLYKGNQVLFIIFRCVL